MSEKKADKKEYATRFGMAFLALLFILTSAGLSLFVVWQNHQQSKTDAAASQSTNAATNSKGTTKLEGTQLKDFTPVAKVDTLQSTDTTPGTGDTVAASSTITANYTGALASTGVIFQSSLDSGQPFTSPLSGLIQGWQVGIPGMKVGGTRRLLIPAAQAYGANPPAGIPANADLVFDIQLISISK